MNIRPLHNQLIVKVKDTATQSSGGIFIPDLATEKPNEGVVLAVGPGVLDKDGCRVPMDVSVGDKVIFGKRAGQTIQVDGAEYLVLKDVELFAVLS